MIIAQDWRAEKKSALERRRGRGVRLTGKKRPAARIEGPAEPANPISIDETEAYSELLSRAHRKTGAIPAQLLVRHVLLVTNGADWPVQREAMDALLRRFASAKADRLEIIERPNASIFGAYETARRGSTARPYRTVLEGVAPPAGSCGCPDFVRGSLGLCKHVLGVLESLASKPRRWKAALAEAASAEPPKAPLLRWDPIRPLTGPGDWLERVSWAGDSHSAVGLSQSALDALKKARIWFLRQRGDGVPLANAHAGEPTRRLELVRDLLALDKLTGKLRGVRRTMPDPALAGLLKREEERLAFLLRDALRA